MKVRHHHRPQPPVPIYEEMTRKQQSAGIPQNNHEAPSHLEEVSFAVYANPNIRQPQDNYYACPRQLALRAWRDFYHRANGAANVQEMTPALLLRYENQRWLLVQEMRRITETNTKEPNGTFLTAKKKAILLIFERSSIVHENICFGACHLTITFYEEKDIQREKK